ncbi:MAG TPA: pyridoxal phosphate-dependent aminotransferase [Myxococcota bacterium]|nr:pyridoxal phosphate-dependent aminotransferase [Myxococcota bacterium]
MFSRRTDWDPSPNALARALASRRAAQRGVVDLTTTNPTQVGLGHPPSFFAGLVDPGAASYEPEPMGLRRARGEVAEYYRARGCACDESAVWLCASTSEAFAYLLALSCDPGDAVLVPRPGYPLLDYLAALSGVRLLHYPLRYDGRWRVDRGALEEALRGEARVRAIFATSPGNPTGAVLSPVELAELESSCAERELVLVVDEVFADYPLAPDAVFTGSALGPRRCLCFVLSGLSKVALLPQLKLGWGVACGPAPRVERALERIALIADSFLSVSTPSQLALGPALAAAPALQRRVRARTRANLAALRGALEGSAGSVYGSEGGWAAIVRLPAVAGLDDEGWALALLERAGVLVHPGGLYDLDGCHAVVSLLGEPEPFAAGAKGLAGALAAAMV